MSEELERLRAFAAEYEKITGEPAKPILRKIARLEAEAADPWREAKAAILLHIQSGGDKVKAVAQYAQHLTARIEAQKKQIDYLHAEYDNRGLQISELVADNDRLEKRVAELEAEHFRLDPETGTLEVDHIGPEPVLDPARVLLTAIGILVGEREFRASASISDAIFRLGISVGKPYRLKGADK